MPSSDGTKTTLNQLKKGAECGLRLLLHCVSVTPVGRNDVSRLGIHFTDECSFRPALYRFLIPVRL